LAWLRRDAHLPLGLADEVRGIRHVTMQQRLQRRLLKL
jgi:hypothetical protein